MRKHANTYKDENGHTLLSLNYAQLFIHPYGNANHANVCTDVSEAGAPDAISCAAKGLLANTISS